MLSTVEVIAITLLSAVIAAWAQYVFKRNLWEFKFNFKGLMKVCTNRNMILGGTMYTVSLLIYLYALNSAPLISFVYPTFASSFVFVLLVSKFALKERVNLHRVLGIALILIGIIVVAFTV